MPTLVLNTENFEGELRGMFARASNCRPPLLLFGAHMRRSVMQTFEAQGRPEPWKPLQIRTILARVTRGNSERKTKRKVVVDARGQRSSGFRSAVQSRAAGTLVTAAQGKTLSRGATAALMNAKILTDRGGLRNSITYQASNLEVRVGTNLRYAATHQFGDADRKIPARPFLVVQPEDREEFRSLLIAHLRGEL